MSKHERMFHHDHAHKLDDPERRQWLPASEVLDRLDVRPGTTVADIGAGTGYFALPLAERVGPDGRVNAVDLQPQMLERLGARVPEGQRVELVHADAAATTLPDCSQDLVFLANVWHEVDDPAATLAEVERITRAGGRVAILDWRADLESPPGPPRAHRVAAETVAALLRAKGWSDVASSTVGTYSHLVVATRPV